MLRTATTGEGGALDHHTGRGIVVDHGVINGDRMYSYYGHLDEVQVEPGDTVEAGTQIGKSGNTGDGTEPPAHDLFRSTSKDPNGAVERRLRSQIIDPVDWLQHASTRTGRTRRAVTPPDTACRRGSDSE